MSRYRNKPTSDALSAVVIVLILLLGSSCERFRNRSEGGISTDQPAAQSESSLVFQLPFGNPTNAANTDRDNYLIVHDEHVISYNNSRGTANWVAWRTRRSDLGESIPRPLFEADPLLPEGFRRIAYYDYSGSGYDRGHLVPSADRFGNKSQNADTFLMTNLVPQTGDLNQFPWEKLESYARSLVFRGNELYTIAGVYGEKGRLRNKVTIPANCWKVIVVFPHGQNSIGPDTRIIAVDMPNIDGIENASWESYKTTVREIEKKTGFDLFSSLPPDLQDQIETRTDGK